jgi:hypothetical protein
MKTFDSRLVGMARRLVELGLAGQGMCVEVGERMIGRGDRIRGTMETRPARRLPAIAVGALLATMLASCGGTDGATAGTPPPATPAPVAVVGVSLASASVGVGETTQASATLRDAGGAVLVGRFVGWSSSSGSVATVSATGLVTAVSSGSAVIIAASEGQSGSASLSVTVAPVATVTVRLVTNSLVVGGTTQAFATLRDANSNVLANRTTTWSTSRASVATVSSTGLVTAVGVGAATVTATSEGITGSADLAVAAPVVVPPVEGQPARMTAVSALDQTGPPGGRVVQPPAVLVADSTGTPLSGVSVSFTVTSGGGGVGGSAAVTGSDGVARATSWTLGGAGTQSVKATSAALAGASVDFAGLARASSAGFDVGLRFVGTMSDAQALAFVHAKERIEKIVVGDLPAVPVNFSAAALADCGGVAVQETIDDILIFAEAKAIDGVGQILGKAGFCALRSAGLPFLGYMQFDTADLARMETNGTLESVILHEMLHVVGFGTLWDRTSLLDATVAADPIFAGASARSAFANLNGGATYAGTPVPVEATGGTSTALSHWRETVLKSELMTGWISTGGAPLSATTIGSLQDLGYTVDLSQAQPFNLATALLASPGLRVGTGSMISDEGVFLGDHLRSEPPIVTDEFGVPVAR